jgi:eukaryotic-like serine/threonine-protein kinase
MPALPSENAPSDDFGPYKVLRRLGEGGYGTTYLVERTLEGGLTKRFCLKHVKNSVPESDPRHAEFIDEAKALSLLDSHPGIVHLVDFLRTERNQLVLVMEYVHGRDLHALLRQLATQLPPRRLPPFVAVHVVAEVCSALDHAHNLPQRVVHRDITPANIFLGTDGHVKLGDFGIATFAGRQQHTATQDIKGNLRYLSPEQLDKANPIDAQSDLFSLGAVLYELLAGRPAFEGQIGQVANSILKGKYRPLAEHAPDVDEELSVLVDLLLAPDKQVRPRSARDVRTRLLRLQHRADARDVLGALVRNSLGDDAELSPPRLTEPLTGTAPKATNSRASSSPLSLPALPQRVMPLHPATSNAPSPTLATTHGSPRREGANTRPATSRRSLHALAIAAAALSIVLVATFRPWAREPASIAQPVPPSSLSASPRSSAPTLSPPTESPATTRPPETASVAEDFDTAKGTVSAAVTTRTTDDQIERESAPAGTPADQPQTRGERRARRSQASVPATSKLTVLVHNFGYVKIGSLGPFRTPAKDIELPAGAHTVRVFDSDQCITELRRVNVDLRPGEVKTLELHVTDKN